MDVDAAEEAWEAALRAPEWSGPPIWFHGDLQSGNLLAQGGRIRAVIDFGCMGVGDPACDLIVAWNLFGAQARSRFRKALQADDATWERGRGWALSVGLIALPYYQTSNPALADIARHAIREVLTESRY
jgi:aminoglycoside phosphotransferase (APT) family kinase protein